MGILTDYLPWLISLLTIWMMFEVGNKRRRGWAISLGTQGLWLTWILVSSSWGLLPLNCAMWIITVRNYRKWSSKGKASMSDPDVESEFQCFWSDIVCNKTGDLDLESVKAELFDYSTLMHNASQVYADVTGGRISKPNTSPDEVISAASDIISDLMEEAYEEFDRAFDSQAQALEVLEARMRLDYDGHSVVPC